MNKSTFKDVAKGIIILFILCWFFFEIGKVLHWFDWVSPAIAFIFELLKGVAIVLFFLGVFYVFYYFYNKKRSDDGVVPSHQDMQESQSTAKKRSLAALDRNSETNKAYDRAIDLDSTDKPEVKKKSALIKTIQTIQASQQVSSSTKPATVSHPNALDFVIERTIFDPVSGTFLLSKNRPLVNVENWIQKNDPDFYWFIVCIHNNSNTLIDEWGIELFSSASLKILECHIEGVEHAPALTEEHPLPWQSKWTIGVPRQFGITLPRGGDSRRLYFKLSSSTCGVSHSIEGNMLAPNEIQIPIQKKSYKHSCDVATLSDALSKNPAAAEQYTEKFLMRSYSRDIALKYLQSFKLVMEMNQSCAMGNHDATVDKLKQLIDALEGIQVSPSLIESAKSNLWAIQQLGDTEDASTRGLRFCQNIIVDWKNEVMFKQKKLG